MPEQFEAFAYIDINNPMAAWNVMRSNFYSASCLPQTERAGAFSFAMASILRKENDQRAVAEFLVEDFRRRNFPDSVSRLTGIFVFDDIDSAAQVWDSESWGAHFTSDYLTDVGVSADNSSRVDAGWITLMRDENNLLAGNWEAMAHKYWSGEPASTSPTWERLIEGWVTVWGLELKQRALQEVKHYWPESLALLAVAANSAAIGSLDGAILPRALVTGGNLSISYYLRMKDAHDSEFCRRLQEFVRTGGNRVCRLGPLVDDCVLPDFNCYRFERRIGEVAWVL